jgi:hypothetical protein
MGELQVTINMEAEIVSEYTGIDGARMFVVQVKMYLPNSDHALYDLIFMQLMPTVTTTTIDDDDGNTKAIYVDAIPENELVVINEMFYGGMIPIPQDVQEAWDNG